MGHHLAAGGQHRDDRDVSGDRAIVRPMPRGPHVRAELARRAALRPRGHDRRPDAAQKVRPVAAEQLEERAVAGHQTVVERHDRERFRLRVLQHGRSETPQLSGHRQRKNMRPCGTDRRLVVARVTPAACRLGVHPEYLSSSPSLPQAPLWMSAARAAGSTNGHDARVTPQDDRETTECRRAQTSFSASPRNTSMTCRSARTCRGVPVDRVLPSASTCIRSQRRMMSRRS